MVARAGAPCTDAPADAGARAAGAVRARVDARLTFTRAPTAAAVHAARPFHAGGRCVGARGAGAHHATTGSIGAAEPAGALRREDTGLVRLAPRHAATDEAARPADEACCTAVFEQAARPTFIRRDADGVRRLPHTRMSRLAVPVVQAAAISGHEAADARRQTRVRAGARGVIGAARPRRLRLNAERRRAAAKPLGAGTWLTCLAERPGAIAGATQTLAPVGADGLAHGAGSAGRDGGKTDTTHRGAHAAEAVTTGNAGVTRAAWWGLPAPEADALRREWELVQSPLKGGQG